jgi:hypothetical protein
MSTRSNDDWPDVLKTYHKKVRQALSLQALQESAKLADRVYRVLYFPSFHPECCLTEELHGTTGQVSLATMQTNLWYYAAHRTTMDRERSFPVQRRPAEPSYWKETAALDDLQSLSFRSSMDALAPHGIQDLHRSYFDGIRFEGEFWEAPDRYNIFCAGNPGHDSAQYHFAKAVYELAATALRDERSVRILEHIHMYLGLGLPAKDLGGDPHRVRLFGSIGPDDETELALFLDGLSSSEPLLLDLSNCDGMGTLIYPTFARFLDLRKGTPTVWWATDQIRPHLEALGVPPSNILNTREEAEVALRQMRP